VASLALALNNSCS